MHWCPCQKGNRISQFLTQVYYSQQMALILIEQLHIMGTFLLLASHSLDSKTRSPVCPCPPSCPFNMGKKPLIFKSNTKAAGGGGQEGGRRQTAAAAPAVAPVLGQGWSYCLPPAATAPLLLPLAALGSWPPHLLSVTLPLSLPTTSAPPQTLLPCPYPYSCTGHGAQPQPSSVAAVLVPCYSYRTGLPNPYHCFPHWGRGG